MQTTIRLAPKDDPIVFQKTDAVIKEHTHQEADERPGLLRDKEQAPEGAEIRNRKGAKPWSLASSGGHHVASCGATFKTFF
jgi:hypothetical protein